MVVICKKKVPPLCPLPLPALPGAWSPGSAGHPCLSPFSPDQEPGLRSVCAAPRGSSKPSFFSQTRGLPLWSLGVFRSENHWAGRDWNSPNPHFTEKAPAARGKGSCPATVVRATPAPLLAACILPCEAGPTRRLCTPLCSSHIVERDAAGGRGRPGVGAARMELTLVWPWENDFPAQSSICTS